MFYNTDRKNIIGVFWTDRDKFEEPFAGVEQAVKKAVGDLTERTLKKKKGVKDYPKKEDDKVKKLKENELVTIIQTYFKGKEPSNEQEFDEWHHTACQKVENALAQYYDNWAYGKAQKIVNMTLKYVYCLDWAEKYRGHFTYCHIPLDSFTLEWIQRKVFPIVKDEIRGKSPIKGNVDSWSNLKYTKRTKKNEKYTYQDFVVWVRGYFKDEKCEYKGLYPLEAEFYIWKEIQLHMALENLCGQFSVQIKKEDDLIVKCNMVKIGIENIIQTIETKEIKQDEN